MPTAEIKTKVLAHLVDNIVTGHDNHTTSGIIGWRFVLDVLSANGHSDVAHAMLTQTSYPSFGYQILNKYEPSTTLWELWDSDQAGPGMNSRNHIMFGGPGGWLHTYVGGISNTKGTIGYQNVRFAPPGELMVLDTPSQQPMTEGSATKHTGRGTYGLFWNLANSSDAMGQSSGVLLSIRSTAPANSIATTVVPLLGATAATVVITESGNAVWTSGHYVAGVDGITGAQVVAQAIEIAHGSGVFDFRLAQQ
jgi:alpha-L-rhamnosidase